jgi:Tfp pilus assembly protein PilF
MKISHVEAARYSKFNMGIRHRDGRLPHRLMFARWLVVLQMLIIASLLAACSNSSSTASPSSPAVSQAPVSAAGLETAAVNCMRNNDLACAESNWSQYVKLRPLDTRGIANLGFVLNKEDKNEQAITLFEKDISMGGGAYDLFAFYADSLGKVGRTDDAIDWSYKTLKLEPTLVDVREKLAELLVLKKRNYEALTLLSEFDEYLDEHGKQEYFLGNRMAIESAMHDLGASGSQEADGLRLVKFNDTFYAPVSVGESGVRAFVVDTGATNVVINNEFMTASKTPYTTVRAHVLARLADGREVDTREVLIDRMTVGPFELDKVKALTCDSCELLLGSNALSSFTMNVAQVKGVDVATLTPHAGALR